MGKKMAFGTGLTTRQKEFLAVVLQNPYLLKSFYLTGGTALSCWYLHHRESYDLDFFSEIGEVNTNRIVRWLDVQKSIIGYSSSNHTEQLGFHFFTFRYPDGSELKVDFSYFPSERITKGLLWNGLYIDSLYDIAVNKYQTIASSPRLKDYVDLYLILQEHNWSLERLRLDAGVKFGMHTETLLVARHFLKVNEFTDMPTMLVPFDRTDMENFFLELAKSLETEIFK